MQYSTYRSVRLVLAGCAALQLACGANSPAAPSSGTDAGAGRGTAVAQNLPPNLNLKTRPAMVGNTVSGEAPFTVEFNLCTSDDPDGDSLNQQFNFGDSGKPAFNPNGTFNPDFEHFCRVEHTYERPGTYTATVSLTDKHLEDQGRNVSSLARKTQTVTVQALGKPEAAATCFGINENFDSRPIGSGTPMPSGSATITGPAVVTSLPFTTLTGNVLIGFATTTVTFAGDQSAASFSFATLFPMPVVVQGFAANGVVPLFTAQFNGTFQPSTFYEGVGGGPAVFRRLEFFSASPYVLDNLVSTPICQ